MTSPPSADRTRSGSPLHRLLSHPAAGWTVVCLGILLRLRRYLQPRGLMHDEAQLAANLFSKSFQQLFRPLDLGDQAAPVGFLLLQKCSILCFGRGEWAIRLVPFLAAAIVLPLFFITIRRFIGGSIPLLATAWLALAEPLIRYSAEGKQYSTDVLWSTVLFALAIGAIAECDLALLAIVGAVLLWFSHPLLFVAGAIGLSLFIEHLRARRFRLVIADVLIGILWLASFALNYLAISRYYAASAYLTDYWTVAFAPMPSTLANMLWYPRSLFGLLDYPLGISPGKFIAISIAASVVFIVGCTLLARQRRIFSILVLTILLALAASALHKYPFADRLTLFLAPLIVLPLAFGLGGDWPFIAPFRDRASITPHFPLPWYSGGGLGWGLFRGVIDARSLTIVLRALLGALLFVYPLYLEAKYFKHPPVLYDVKPALQYIHDHGQAGDVIYLHFGSDVLGRYYLSQPEFALPDMNLVPGVYEPDLAARPSRYADDLRSVLGRPRVWIVFSMAAQPDRQIYEKLLDQRGRRLDRRVYDGGAVELYDLRKTAPIQSQP